MIPFSANVTVTAAANIANAFEWPGQNPKIALPNGDLHPIQLTVPRVYPSLHPKRHFDRFSRFCTARRIVSHYLATTLPLPLGVSGPPSNTWYLWPTRVIKPSGILDQYSRFGMGAKCYAVQCTVNGEEVRKIAHSLGIAPPRQRSTEPQR